MNEARIIRTFEKEKGTKMEYKVVCKHWCEDKSHCPLWNTPGCTCLAVITADNPRDAERRALNAYRQAHQSFDARRRVAVCVGRRGESGRMDGPTAIHFSKGGV